MTEAQIVAMPAVIGILGGVASGKSLVAGQLAQLGAEVLDADRAGHEALRLPKVEAAARERWGGTVFDADGRIDRSALAEVVFALPPNGPAEREYLEQITHPAIGRLLQQQAEQLAAEATTVVLDAPLLLEAGWAVLCDQLIFVDAPRELRLKRALGRGWSEEDFSAREAAQQPLGLKKRLAAAIIDNSGSKEQTFAQVEHLWPSLFG
jgi:dephospho-CoA kinase